MGALDHAFGKPLSSQNGDSEEGLTDLLDGHGLGDIVHVRLSRSKCTTKDPRLADVFVVPMLLRTKSGPEWSKKCSVLADAGDITKMVELLPHLTESSASRHVFFRGHGYIANNPSMCSGWWQRPIPELKPTLRFTPNTKQAPGVVGIPFPSMVHWSRNFRDEPPWARTRSRSVLMTFVHGDRKMAPGAKTIRDALLNACRSYGPGVCREVLFPARAFTQDTARLIADMYRGAEFCLQPIGDSCDRKGIMDSILLGCIPVMFHWCEMRLWHYHWGGWIKESVVYIEARTLVRGETDLKASLTSIPLAKREAMRASIQKNGHRLQYSLEDPSPEEEDALSIVLDIVARQLVPSRRRRNRSTNLSMPPPTPHDA